MYNKFFGFKEKPFKLVPNPIYLFLSKSHEEALAHLTYAITQGDGFVEITGEVGTGKTTLCRVFLENLDSDIEAAYIFNPKLDALQLLKAINDEFGIDSSPDNTKDLIDRLNGFLIEIKSAGKKALVLIDEAQNLSLEVLEQLRLLSNLETTREKLLQIILVGQPELGEILSSHQLRQLGQRITINCQLTPLTFQETKDYIRHRIALASHRAGPPFDSASYRAIYAYSRGVPRLINIACDRALLNGFSRNSHKITGAIAKEAISELTRKKSQPVSFGRRQGTVGAIVICALFIPLVLLLLQTINKPVSSPVSEPPQVVQSAPSAPEKAAAEAVQTPVDAGLPAEESPSLAAEPEASLETSSHPEAAEAPDLEEKFPAASEVVELTAEKNKIPITPPASETAETIADDPVVHSVHVGTFSTFSLADKRLAEMKGLGYPSFMYTQTNTSGKTDYVVVAGTYQSPEEAKETGRSLSRKGYSNFITRAKDSLVDAPAAVEQQAIKPVPEITEPAAAGSSENFLNYLRGLNSRYSRNSSMKEILRLWLPDAEINIKQAGISTDRFFFQEAASQYELQVQPVATEADLDLVRNLNLPAVFTFYLIGHSWPKYLAVTGIDKEKIYFAAAGQDNPVSVDKDILLQYWSGEAYIFWKDFNELQDLISLNSSGRDVKTLKMLLQQLGYDNIAMTEVYDQNTMQIIKDIQTKYGLRVDGLVGALTKIALYNESQKFMKPSLVKFEAVSRENGS